MKRHLTYSNVIASIALLLAMTGGAVAATNALEKESVGTRQLKKEAVNSNKVKNNSLRAVDFKAGQLPEGPRGTQGAKGETGAKGAQGAEGPQGVPGTAKAYGVVASNGNLNTGSFGGLVAERKGEGEYCISIEGQPVSALANMQVAADYGSSSTTFWSPATQTFTIAGVVGSNNICGAGTREVRVYKIDNDAATMGFTDAQFRVIVP
jgi:hypothetical protein